MSELEIHVPDDCGNAPRKAVVRDVVVAMACHDADAVLAFFAEDVEWHIAGERRLCGRDAVAGYLGERADRLARRLELRQVLTHGRDAAAHGVLTLADGTAQAFCHVLLFTGDAKTAPVRQVTSYVIVETDA